MSKPNPRQFFVVNYDGPFHSQQEAEEAAIEWTGERYVVKAQAFEVIVAMADEEVTRSGNELEKLVEEVSSHRWFGELIDPTIVIMRKGRRVIREKGILDGLYNERITEHRRQH